MAACAGEFGSVGIDQAHDAIPREDRKLADHVGDEVPTPSRSNVAFSGAKSDSAGTSGAALGSNGFGDCEGSEAVDR